MKVHASDLMLSRFHGLSPLIIICVFLGGCREETSAENHVTYLPLSPAETIAGTGHRVFFNKSGEPLLLDKHALIQNQRKLAENWGVGTAAHLPLAEEVEVNFQSLDQVLEQASAERKPGAASARQINTAFSSRSARACDFV